MQKSIKQCSLALGITMLGAATGWAAPASQPAATQSSAEVARGSSAPKILVLPFHDAAAGNYPWVGKAIQQDIVADLTRSTRASLEALSSAPAAEDFAAALDAGKHAGAELVVYGQYQTVGAQMRITGQIVSVAAGQPIGSINATGEVTNLFPLEDNVSIQVLRALPAGVVTIPLPPVTASPGSPPSTVAPASTPDFSVSPGTTQSGQYYSYTYPDYFASSGYPEAYFDSPYYYAGYPYYWYAVPYFEPDLFFFGGFDHYHDHHHFHNFGGADRWHEGGLHGFGDEGRFGRYGFTHAPASHYGGGAFHSSGGGAGGHAGGGGGGHH